MPRPPTKAQLLRAVKAHCYECMGGENDRFDCLAPSCSLYFWKRNRESEPYWWWMAPKSEWKNYVRRPTDWVLKYEERDRLVRGPAQASTFDHFDLGDGEPYLVDLCS